jgi:hypothetical protein
MGSEYENTRVIMFDCLSTEMTALRALDEPAANLTTALDSETHALASHAVPPTLDARQLSNLPKASPNRVTEYEPEVARWENEMELKTGADAESKLPEIPTCMRVETTKVSIIPWTILDFIRNSESDRQTVF